MSNKGNEIVRAVLYLRLSNEDEGKLTKEEKSESIKNQEMMLKDYAKEQGYEIVGIYNDEDWSGADSTRPEFNKMIKECESGNVDVVIAKTQARFARDMELIERYIHDKFIEWNVQFKTVVDRIDNTKRETKKTSQILGLTDEWYLEDTSYNIRQTFKTKRENGEFTGSFAPYGYAKDPENKNHLVIDPVAAEVVKRIFNDFIGGMGIKTVANSLNEDFVLSPLEYKYMNGYKLQVPFINDYMFFESIKKAGMYKVNVVYKNEERKVLHNLISYNVLSEDRKTFDNKCKIYLRQYSEDRMKIYYTKEKEIDYNNFRIELWNELKLNEQLPNDTTCIATLTENLDRTHSINYQFEILLEENVDHKEYFFDVLHVSNDEKSAIDYNVIIRKKYKWCQQMIKKILTDEVYIGNLVQSKTTSVSYKNKKKIKKDPSDWIRVENMHDAIITEDLWIKAQERLKERARCDKNGTYNPFLHKLYCKECGRVFTRSGDCKHIYYRCKDLVEKYHTCDNRSSINNNDLHSLVIDGINELLDNFYKDQELNNFKENDIDNDLFKEKLDSLNKELISIDKELQTKKTYFQRLYEDRANGLLDTEEYMMLKTKYKEDSERLENRAKKIHEEIELCNTKKKVLKGKQNIFNKYKHVEKLDVDIVSDFVDKILIGKLDKVNKTRDIKIVWNFSV
ncbi:MAG: recombinase family protein [Bacilli bacterium]